MLSHSVLGGTSGFSSGRIFNDRWNMEYGSLDLRNSQIAIERATAAKRKAYETSFRRRKPMIEAGTGRVARIKYMMKTTRLEVSNFSE